MLKFPDKKSCFYTIIQNLKSFTFFRQFPVQGNKVQGIPLKLIIELLTIIAFHSSEPEENFEEISKNDLLFADL